MIERLAQNETVWMALAVGLAVLTQAGEAEALLLDKAVSMADEEPVAFTYHYPYPTSLTYVDPGYAFDDDPLMAFPNVPYTMPVIIKRVAVRRAMVTPRTSFVQQMYDSTDLL